MSEPHKADLALQALNDKLAALVEFILEKNNLYTELKNMARSTSRALKEFAKVRQAVVPVQVAPTIEDVEP